MSAELDGNRELEVDHLCEVEDLSDAQLSMQQTGTKFKFLRKGQGTARFANPSPKVYDAKDEDFYLTKGAEISPASNRTFTRRSSLKIQEATEAENEDFPKDWEVLSGSTRSDSAADLSMRDNLDEWFSKAKISKIKMTNFEPNADSGIDPLLRSLKSKTSQLDQMIHGFSRQNRVLLQLMRENERAKQKLEEDQANFEKQRKIELEKIRDLRKRENERIHLENEKLKQATKIQTSLQEQTEDQSKQITTLKERLNSLRQEIRQKDRSVATSQEKLRAKIAELESENAQLKTTNKTLEIRKRELCEKLNVVKRDQMDNACRDQSNNKFGKINPAKEMSQSTNSSEGLLDKAVPAASLEIFLERQLQNGGKEIRLNDGSRTIIDTSGIIITETCDGDRLINYPDGRREFHTNNYRKKFYPNKKTVIEFKDGRVEVDFDGSK